MNTQYWKNILSVPAKMSLPEIIFVMSGIFMGIGFAWKSSIFAKMGIPIELPPAFGGVRHLKVSIYIFEIYLFFLSALFLLTNFRKIKQKLLDRKSILFYLALFLFIFGIARLFVDIKVNPILGIRNAAFSWYLYFPLFLYLCPIQTKTFELYARVMI